MSVAMVLRERRADTSGNPSVSRTARHCLPKFVRLSDPPLTPSRVFLRSLRRTDRGPGLGAECSVQADWHRSTSSDE